VTTSHDEPSEHDLRPHVVARPVRRAFPSVRDEWTTVAAHVSTMLLELIEQESDGDLLPPPLAHRVALQAWGRIKTGVSAALDHSTRPICTVPVSPDDLAVLGAASRELGRSQLPGGNPAVAAALDRAARPLERSPQQLIMQLARVHGVLDLDDRTTPDGTGPPPPTEPLALRIATMWHAGDDPENP
jgi:hypothetical protein